MRQVPPRLDLEVDGLAARRNLYEYHSCRNAKPDWVLADTILLHHMNPMRPDISLAIANAPPWCDPKALCKGDLETELDAYLRSPQPSFKGRQPGRTCLGLPITLRQKHAAATVLACADTAAEVNVMSRDMAQLLGYTTYESSAEPALFELANGNVVQSLGHVTASCSFGVDSDTTAAISCIFQIFMRAASPIIMGLAFLEETRTMTEHRNRLVRVARPNLRTLSVCSLSRPRQLLSCELDHKPTLVTLDSGSDIDIISSRLVKERGFFVHQEQHVFELADGSLTISPGFVRLTLSIAKPFGQVSSRPTHVSTLR